MFYIWYALCIMHPDLWKEYVNMQEQCHVEVHYDFRAKERDHKHGIFYVGERMAYRILCYVAAKLRHSESIQHHGLCVTFSCLSGTLQKIETTLCYDSSCLCLSVKNNTLVVEHTGLTQPLPKPAIWYNLEPVPSTSSAQTSFPIIHFNNYLYLW